MNESKVPELEPVKNELGRRTFIGGAALAGAVLAACNSGGSQPTASLGPKMTPGLQQAPEGRPLRTGLIGCGGRGTGAALNHLDAGPGLEIVALTDLFQDRLDSCRSRLNQEKGVEVADNMCFVGFDGYQKLLETDIDIVIQATPPHFRPDHVAAAVEARKHIFLEKPVGVDPWGVKSIMDSAERAEALGLCVATGTQFRHQKSFIETYNRVMDGAIGEIVAARAYSLRGQLWYKVPQPEWSPMEAMLRDWVNWNWLSGDHIVEQHIHGLDVLFWFTGAFPTKGVATGGRARRVTGDQYDYFSVDYELDSGVHMTTMCRQIDGCTNRIERWVVGTKGITNCQDTIFGLDGSVVWQYEGTETDNSPYVQEHIDMVTAIRNDEPFVEASETAKSTLGAVMARESAYTGLEVTWDELMSSDMRLGPTEYAMGPVEGIDVNSPVVPVPGIQEEA